MEKKDNFETNLDTKFDRDNGPMLGRRKRRRRRRLNYFGVLLIFVVFVILLIQNCVEKGLS